MDRSPPWLAIITGVCGVLFCLGIGGSGEIAYVDENGSANEESKSFGYTTHQLNYFIGPIVPVAADAAGFLASAFLWAAAAAAAALALEAAALLPNVAGLTA